MQLFRRLLALLIVTAYLGATMTGAAAMAPSAMGAMMGAGMVQQQNDASDPMPCKGKIVPRCVNDLGCIFLLSLPTLPDLALSTAAHWSSVTYAAASGFLNGRSIKPALGPPISHT